MSSKIISDRSSDFLSVLVQPESTWTPFYWTRPASHTRHSNPVSFYLGWGNPVLTVSPISDDGGEIELSFHLSSSAPPSPSLCIVVISPLSPPHLSFVPLSLRKPPFNKTPVLCLLSVLSVYVSLPAVIYCMRRAHSLTVWYVKNVGLHPRKY